MKLLLDIDKGSYNRIKDDNALLNDLDAFLVSIKNSIPYEERPQGRWIEEGTEVGAFGIKYSWNKCSKCGWSSSLIIPKNFCPNCGTDMRGNKNG